MLAAGECRALGETGEPSTPHQLKGREGRKEKREGGRDVEKREKDRDTYTVIVSHHSQWQFRPTITLLLVRTMALEMEMLEAPATV